MHVAMSRAPAADEGAALRLGRALTAIAAAVGAPVDLLASRLPSGSRGVAPAM